VRKPQKRNNPLRDFKINVYIYIYTRRFFNDNHTVLYRSIFVSVKKMYNIHSSKCIYNALSISLKKKLFFLCFFQSFLGSRKHLCPLLHSNKRKMHYTYINIEKTSLIFDILYFLQVSTSKHLLLSIFKNL